jgi:hypothetical protein
MKTYFYTLLTLMTLSNLRVQAQGKITGQVTDNKNKIVEFATITLLQAKDSSLVKALWQMLTEHLNLKKSSLATI